MPVRAAAGEQSPGSDLRHEAHGGARRWRVHCSVACRRRAAEMPVRSGLRGHRGPGQVESTKRTVALNVATDGRASLVLVRPSSQFVELRYRVTERHARVSSYSIKRCSDRSRSEKNGVFR